MGFPFEIKFLDHVAIRVKDISTSIDWYERVLGLKTYRFKAWGEFPIFMFKNKSGIALFPANLNDPAIDRMSRNIKIDHFAFNVSNIDFLKAQDHLKDMDIEFEFQDHIYFHSIYMSDPDGHKVELTTLIGSEDDFY